MIGRVFIALAVLILVGVVLGLFAVPYNWGFAAVAAVLIFLYSSDNIKNSSFQ
jgi:ABC-type transport system involved in Fe-S cluster assembly fused permease/ATPase subunit